MTSRVPSAGAAADDKVNPAAGTAPTAHTVCSMTGYGRAAVQQGDGVPGLSLTLKSTNHRFLDVQVRLPAVAEPLEGPIRARLKEELRRGHVECVLGIERGASREGTERRATTQFARTALRRYVADFQAAAAELGLTAEPDLNVAAQLPGMLTVPEPPEDVALAPLLEERLPGMLEEALRALQTMRAREGAALSAVLHDSLRLLADGLNEVVSLRGQMQPVLFERLRRRLVSLVGDTVDEKRLLTEAALLAERGDVEEEAARLHAHIGSFRAILAAGGEVGKRLDFLLQEMNREANTLLSKTGGASEDSLRITECGLAMKAEIEKLREQVQNLE